MTRNSLQGEHRDSASFNQAACLQRLGASSPEPHPDEERLTDQECSNVSNIARFDAETPFMDAVNSIAEIRVNLPDFGVTGPGSAGATEEPELVVAPPIKGARSISIKGNGAFPDILLSPIPNARRMGREKFMNAAIEAGASAAVNNRSFGKTATMLHGIMLATAVRVAMHKKNITPRREDIENLSRQIGILIPNKLIKDGNNKNDIHQEAKIFLASNHPINALLQDVVRSIVDVEDRKSTVADPEVAEQKQGQESRSPHKVGSSRVAETTNDSALFEEVIQWLAVQLRLTEEQVSQVKRGGRSTEKLVSIGRQAAAYILKHESKMNHAEIGNEFGVSANGVYGIKYKVKIALENTDTESSNSTERVLRLLISLRNKENPTDPTLWWSHFALTQPTPFMEYVRSRVAERYGLDADNLTKNESEQASSPPNLSEARGLLAYILLQELQYKQVAEFLGVHNSYVTSLKDRVRESGLTKAKSIRREIIDQYFSDHSADRNS